MTPLLAEPREWTDTEGRTILAEFIKSEDGSVTLKIKERIFVVSLDTLSEEDRSYIQEHEKAYLLVIDLREGTIGGRPFQTFVRKYDNEMEARKAADNFTEWVSELVGKSKSDILQLGISPMVNPNTGTLAMHIELSPDNAPSKFRELTGSDSFTGLIEPDLTSVSSVDSLYQMLKTLNPSKEAEKLFPDAKAFKFSQLPQTELAKAPLQP